MAAKEIQIFLNVYDLHESNSILASLGAGFFHTGVEIDSYEYSFSPSGVNRTSPRLDAFGQLKEHLLMGIYIGRPGDLRQIITDLGRTDFQPGLYNAVTLNCNHFSDALVFALLGQHIPSYINRVANIGSYVLPSSATSSAKTQTEEAFPAPGVANKPPSQPVGAPMSKQASTTQDGRAATNSGAGFFDSIFSFFGSSTASSATPTATSSTDKKVEKTTSAGGKKKELSEKQRVALAKLKQNNSM
ncbi:hypothetical protein EON65_24330 [archaeon]|nr:MAG: hypothetical protein EON65_24330 [archaeon]